MLSGVACRYRIVENGRRQIFTFHYAGDFATITVTSCRNGMIRWCDNGLPRLVLFQDIERTIEHHPQVGLALLAHKRAGGAIFQERVLNGLSGPPWNELPACFASKCSALKPLA